MPGLKTVCDGWKRDVRQNVNVRVHVLRSVLKRKSVRIQEVKPSLYTIALVRQTWKILKRLVVCLNFKGDSVEYLSVKLDGPDDRGAFQLRNTPHALIVESGSAEVAEGPNGIVGLLLFYYHTESVCACIRNEPEFP